MEERRNQQRRARAARAGRVRRRRQRRQNRTGVLCISCIVLLLLAAMSVQIFHLHEENEDYKALEEQLTAELESEQQRQEEIASYEEYVTTPEYIEQIAKTKLGLVYSNEIIFKESNKDN